MCVYDLLDKLYNIAAVFNEISPSPWNIQLEIRSDPVYFLELNGKRIVKDLCTATSHPSPYHLHRRRHSLLYVISNLKNSSTY